MGLFEKPVRFSLGGRSYEHADPRPDLVPGSVRRFTYGEEPTVIAQVPLNGGEATEVHGYATHYNLEWVTVEWMDDSFQHLSCWVPAADVRRPTEGEWRGKYIPYG